MSPSRLRLFSSLSGVLAIGFGVGRVAAQDFNLDASPLNPSPVSAGGNSSSTISVTPTGSFNQTVSLSVGTYAEDAFFIAEQLITDLNNRGGDIRFRVKSLLHFESADDARRNLVRIMKQNSVFRTSYKSSNSNRIYVFEGHKRYVGIFHVWRIKEPSLQLGTEMEDVDNWHVPRSPNLDRVDAATR